MGTIRRCGRITYTSKRLEVRLANSREGGVSNNAKMCCLQGSRALHCLLADVNGKNDYVVVKGNKT